MQNKTLIRILKILMCVGFTFIILGVYLHYSALTADLGVNGILLSAGCVALGMAMSLPTKMYLTFVFMNRENEKNAATRHKQ